MSKTGRLVEKKQPQPCDTPSKIGICENCKKRKKLVRSGVVPAWVCMECADDMFNACLGAFFGKKTAKPDKPNNDNFYKIMCMAYLSFLLSYSMVTEGWAGLLIFGIATVTGTIFYCIYQILEETNQ